MSRQQDDRACAVREERSGEIDEASCRAGTSRAIAHCLRDRAEGLSEYLALTERQIAQVGVRPWMAEELLDFLQDELRYLNETALAVEPPEGRA